MSSGGHVTLWGPGVVRSCPPGQGKCPVLLTAFSGGTLKSLSAERRTKGPGRWDVNVGGQVGQTLVTCGVPATASLS